jgi:hypothetical protein
MQPSLSASAEVTQTERAYRARVRIAHAGRVGERLLEHDRCDVLADSVALVISLSASAGDSVRAERVDAPRSRPVFTLAAQAVALFGALPSPGLGIGGALAAEDIASLRFELRGAYFLPQSTTFEPGGPGATFRLFALGARGCRTWSFGAFDLAPCIGADVYRMAASGFGGSPSLDGSATWWGPAFGALSRVRLVKAFAIYIAVEGIVPITRRRFVFADVGQLHRAGPIALQLILAPEVRF